VSQRIYTFGKSLLNFFNGIDFSKYGDHTFDAYSRIGRTYVINACLSICRLREAKNLKRTPT